MDRKKASAVINPYEFPPAETVAISDRQQDLLMDFAESALTLLREIEHLGLEYEAGQRHDDRIQAVKRSLHQLKGEAGVMGSEVMSSVFHEIERLFEELDPDHKGDILLRAHDWGCQAVAWLTGEHALGNEISDFVRPRPEPEPVPEQPDFTARELMKTNLLTIRPDANIYEAIATLISRDITALPVVLPNSALVGILSEKDVLRLLYDLEVNSDRVEDYMTRDVVVFSPDDSIRRITDCLLRNDFRRVMIIENGRLAGMVSRRNIISAYKEMFEKTRPEYRKKKRRIFTASDVMVRGLVTVNREANIYEVVNLILEHNLTALPVVNDDMTLAGIISEKDVMDISLDLGHHNGRVQDYMTSRVVSFAPDDSLIDICDCLIQNPFRQVAVLENSRLAGIISRRDIIELILSRRASCFRRRRSDR